MLKIVKSDHPKPIHYTDHLIS